MYERYEVSVIGVQTVRDEEVSRYGIVEGHPIGPGLYNIGSLIEKPGQDEAPSNLAIMGRYILTPAIFEQLSLQEPGAGGEIQLTDALAQLNEHEEIYAYEFDGKRYDVGEKLGFITTTIEFAMQHAELREELLAYLEEKRWR